MKTKQLFYLVFMIVLATPMLADAQIYKWKDKNGVTRYSDTPPTGNANVDKIGKASTGKPKPPPPKPTKAEQQKIEAAEDEAARLRARNAEIEKRNKAEKAAQAKIKAENCRAAKSDYATFAQGGRIYEMDENGERNYFDSASMDARKAQAQQQINEYCY